LPDRWGIILVAILAGLPSAYLGARDRGDASESPPAALHTVDVNRAPWWELTAVRHIGEITAREIVARRESAVHEPGRAERPFQSPADLDAVRGIGPKTIERIAPFLRFGDSS
jgi:DNA uptake protein ComE-like DNA-binding protein